MFVGMFQLQGIKMPCGVCLEALNLNCPVRFLGNVMVSGLFVMFQAAAIDSIWSNPAPIKSLFSIL